MNRREKERMEDRLSGMRYALMVLEDKGVDELKKELKFRGATYIPFEIGLEKIDEIFTEIITKIYNSYGVAVYKVLHENFGFGKSRLDKFTKEFDDFVDGLATVDHYGDMLYTFEDYAKEFNTKMGTNFDLDKIAEVDGMNQRASGKEAIKKTIKAVELVLVTYGYPEAADFLVKYLGDDEDDEIDKSAKMQ